MSEQSHINKIVDFCFTLQLLNRLYHWQTTSFARHKATDELNTTISCIIDKFVEVYMGRYGVKPIIHEIKLDNIYLTDDGIIKLFVLARNYLKDFETSIRDTDLLNIRDELLAAVNKTLYLFTLN